MNSTRNNSSGSKNVKQIFVLLFVLLIIPLLWGLGIFKFPINYLFPKILRPSFWTFFTSIFILEWVAFFVIFIAIRKQFYKTLSINRTFIEKNYRKLIFVILTLIITAGLAPEYLYSEELPDNSLILKDIGPVGSIERICFVFLALTAGICEEIIFRGYGITMLEKTFKNKTIALFISSFCFMSLHGIAFLPWYLLLQYFIIGLLFGFLFQKYRRLEILILIHFLLDALIAVFVP